MCSANKKNRPEGRFFYWHLGEVDENSRGSEFDYKRERDEGIAVSFSWRAQ